jgi:2-dehydropantoate 2-reductase
MKSIEKVYISGLGAVGGSYAGKLYEMDKNSVSIIVNEARMASYKKDGFRINGRRYDFDYVLPDSDGSPADLIIIAVKQHHLEQAIKDIHGFVGENTIILSLLNGIISEEVLAGEYGFEKLLYSFCVGTDSVRDRSSIQYTRLGRIVFGEKNNAERSEKVAAVEELFKKAGIPYEIPVDMMSELWWKFMMNVGINQTSAVLRAPYGVFQDCSEALELMASASREVVRIAEKAGIELKEDDIGKYVEILKTLSPDGKTSMLQDVEAGRKTEVEIFSGTVIEYGRKYGVPTPVNDILFKMIRTIEKMRQIKYNINQRS